MTYLQDIRPSQKDQMNINRNASEDMFPFCALYCKLLNDFLSRFTRLPQWLILVASG